MQISFRSILNPTEIDTYPVVSFFAADQVFSLFWLLHSDLHENRATAALEYMSSMKATIEQMVHPDDGQRANSENVSIMEHNLRRGKLCVHVKRRNGRVRMMVLLPP